MIIRAVEITAQGIVAMVNQIGIMIEETVTVWNMIMHVAVLQK